MATWSVARIYTNLVQASAKPEISYSIIEFV